MRMIPPTARTTHPVNRYGVGAVRRGRDMAAHVIELVVRGPLWPSLLAALDGFAVETDADGRTVIVGPVVDQAQMLGILDMFDGLNVEVVSVNPLEPKAR